MGDEDEGDDGDDEEQITLAEMMDLAMKLENGAPAIGAHGDKLSSLSPSSELSLGR